MSQRLLLQLFAADPPGMGFVNAWVRFINDFYDSCYISPVYGKKRRIHVIPQLLFVVELFLNLHILNKALHITLNSVDKKNVSFRI